MSVRYAYICSAARCGSTITDMFLGGHSAVTSLGELNLLGRAILSGECSCGDPVKDCAEWGKVFSRVKERTDIDLSADRYGLRLWDARAFVEIDKEYQTLGYVLAMRARGLWMDLREMLGENYYGLMPVPKILKRAIANKLGLYEDILAAWNARLVVDSSKNIREALQLYNASPKHVRVIFVTRDGRGTYLSRRKSGWSRRASVQGWLKYYKRALNLVEKRFPEDAVLKVSYEYIAAKPVEAGKAICDFLELEYEPSMLDIGTQERHLVSGNDTRFSASKGIKLDEKWRNELTGAELAYFERVGGFMNKRLGYE